uniref:Uncharacterized protein n=1 Tax=Arundo donax TaxID=35708 RepID=A0A0A9C208_ARUDO
MAKFQNQCFFI